MQDYELSVGEKFAKAQRLVAALYPSLTSFYLMCNIHEVPDVTFRLNTRVGLSPTLEYSKKFIDSLTSNTLCVLLTIELFRLILHHPTSRLLYPVHICYRASTIICTDPDILTLPMDMAVKEKFPSFDEVKKINPELDYKTDFYLEKIFAVLNSKEQEDKGGKEKSENPTAQPGNKASKDDTTPEPEPTKEGYTFSGWSEIPETMPDHDVTVTGSFIVNKYI